MHIRRGHHASRQVGVREVPERGMESHGSGGVHCGLGEDWGRFAGATFADALSTSFAAPETKRWKAAEVVHLSSSVYPPGPARSARPTAPWGRAGSSSRHAQQKNTWSDSCSVSPLPKARGRSNEMEAVFRGGVGAHLLPGEAAAGSQCGVLSRVRGWLRQV